MRKTKIRINVIKETDDMKNIVKMGYDKYCYNENDTPIPNLSKSNNNTKYIENINNLNNISENKTQSVNLSKSDNTINIENDISNNQFIIFETYERDIINVYHDNNRFYKKFIFKKLDSNFNINNFKQNKYLTTLIKDTVKHINAKFENNSYLKLKG